MDSDKVLVMNSGKMVEFDHPHYLLQNPDGYFTKMVEETGPSMTIALRDVAKRALDAKLEHNKLNGSVFGNEDVEKDSDRKTLL